METTLPVSFPCTSLPEEPSAGRLLGLYPQRQTGLWMQRVRVDGGRLEGSQWAVLAELAERFAPGQPLHLTTRQDVELHGLTAAVIPEVQRQLAEAGLTGRGACGDTIRNVTVCPCSGTAPDAPDLLPLAAQLTRRLQAQPGAFALPRKFKVSLSACAAGCAQPGINDLGLVALPRGRGWQFQAVLGGSLGPKPGTGIACRRLLEAEEVLPLAAAALAVFAAYGDRQHRHAARLRHVRQRLGDQAFLKAVELAFQAAQRDGTWPAVPLAAAEPPFGHRRILRLADGNVSVEQARSLAMLARRDDVRIRIANHHQVVIFARDEQALEDTLALAGLANFARSAPSIVACPGTRWCARAVADAPGLAAAVRQRLTGAGANGVLIGISGCPNGCAQGAVADVGAVGLASGGPDRRQEVWTILAGGQGGRGPGLGQTVAERLAPKDAAERIAELAIQAASPPASAKEKP